MEKRQFLARVYSFLARKEGYGLEITFGGGFRFSITHDPKHFFVLGEIEGGNNAVELAIQGWARDWRLQSSITSVNCSEGGVVVIIQVIIPECEENMEAVRAGMELIPEGEYSVTIVQPADSYRFEVDM